jgi:hypothetical protein
MPHVTVCQRQNVCERQEIVQKPTCVQLVCKLLLILCKSHLLLFGKMLSLCYLNVKL